MPLKRLFGDGRPCLKTVIPRSGATRNLGLGSPESAWTHHPRPLAALGVTCNGDF